MGTLYLIGTPIGNLEDITLRAVRVLGEVELVVAEDTREARKLLRHFGVEQPTVAFHDDSGPAALEAVLNALESGDVAYVTDAGMPGVSDPASLLVRAALAHGHVITSIPGVSAVTTAVAAAGFADSGFVFGGFLPRRSAARRRELKRLASLALPVVLFESPRRVQALLGDIEAELPEAQVVVGRELTKLHEEWRRGTAGQVAAGLREQGEFTLVILPGAPSAHERTSAELDTILADAFQDGRALSEVVAEVSEVLLLPRREVYRRALELREGTP
jgi:16S rRNA (cytidine1402-2'-O)-methyltransferase